MQAEKEPRSLNICFQQEVTVFQCCKAHKSFRRIHFIYSWIPFPFCTLQTCVLHHWCAKEPLTSVDLYVSRFMGFILTLRMTAPANATSVCPLTQRLTSLLSKVRSRSDYNPFASSCYVSFGTSWQPLFQLISHKIATIHWRQGHLCCDPTSVSTALFDWALKHGIQGSANDMMYPYKQE